MNKREYRQYLKSDRWQTLRKEILQRDKFRCRLCNATPSIHGIQLQVHHADYSNIGHPEEAEDCITLCSYHHALIEERIPRESRLEPAIA
jgi:5-methylcytosine-specific restriction endonuclease McrA